MAWAPTRDEAIDRMQRALLEYQIEGIQTNLAFFREILDHHDFRKGDFDTGFIDRWLREREPRKPASETERDLALIAAALADDLEAPAPPPATTVKSVWKTFGRIRGLRR